MIIKKIKDVYSTKNNLDFNIKIRNNFLKKILLTLKENKEKIIRENKKDLALFKDKNSPVYERLILNEKKIKDLILGINSLIKLEDPLNKNLLNREIDKNLILKKITVPLGVIGVIFEARPDALIQISSLMIKTNNAFILKGGSECRHTNKCLFNLIYTVGLSLGYPKNFMLLLDTRDEIKSMLKLDEYINLLIPRGSNKLIKYIMSNTKIQVLGHSDGICHIYLDKNYPINKAEKIIIDAKTDYPSACNSVECLLINKSIKKTDVEKLIDKLSKQMKIYYPKTNKQKQKEFLDKKINIVFVKDTKEAVSHINKFGSHHTDSILTNDKNSKDFFVKNVDSANVFINVSTRFADGFRFGLGAEVGISTSKIHARGPVGLEGLLSTKYILKSSSDNNIVSDYSTGKRTFKFKEL